MALERRRRGEVTKYFAPQIQLDFKPPHDTAVSEILKALSKFVANNPRIDERRSIRPWLKSDAAKRWISEVLIEYISVERGIWTPLYAVPTDATGFDLDAGLRAVELLLARGADVGRSQRSRSSGLHFSLGVRLNGAKKSSALETASRRQAIFRSKKRDPVSKPIRLVEDGLATSLTCILAAFSFGPPGTIQAIHRSQILCSAIMSDKDRSLVPGIGQVVCCNVRASHRGERLVLLERDT